jgi:hypothetical protein
MRRSPLPIAVVLLAAVSVAAQEMRPVSYVAEFKINRSEAAEWINLVRKYDKPMLDKLMADGTVLTWGLDAVVVRREESVTHRIWVVSADYAGMDKVIAGFNAMRTPPKDVARYLQIANLSALQEHYVRSILFKMTDVPPTVRPYRSYSGTKLKPGKVSDWQKLFDQYNRPVLDKLMADGIIYGYGVDVEDFHTDDPGWRWVWVVTPNMAAFDKIAAANEKRSEATRAAVAQEFENVIEPGAHRNQLYRTVVTGGRSEK